MYQMDAEFLDDKWFISLEGEIDIFNASEFKEELLTLLDEKSADLILNCKGLEYVDSTAIGVLIGILKEKSSKGKYVKLVGINEKLEEMLEMTDLDYMFLEEETVEEGTIEKEILDELARDD